MAAPAVQAPPSLYPGKSPQVTLTIVPVIAAALSRARNAATSATCRDLLHVATRDEVERHVDAARPGGGAAHVLVYRFLVESVDDVHLYVAAGRHDVGGNSLERVGRAPGFGALSSNGRIRLPVLDIVAAIPKNGFVTVGRDSLETERLRLEPISSAHVEALHQAVIDSRPELLPWMPWAREPSVERGREAAAVSESAWREGREFHFAVRERSAGAVLGVVGLNREGSSAAELHYWIRSDHTGKGLATEAARALIEWAPAALGVNRLTLWAGRDNQASRRVATKLGFAHVGVLRWRPEGGLGTFDAESYELDLLSHLSQS